MVYILLHEEGRNADTDTDVNKCESGTESLARWPNLTPFHPVSDLLIS
jgi:hypothetical protein